MKSKDVELSVIRFDQLHPIISGNKLFKLYYFLEQVQQLPVKKLITFGGVYSNHLVATAFASKEGSIECVGIVRGEEPAALSQTLIDCGEYGMQLKFVSRNEYDQKESQAFAQNIFDKYGECVIVPEGGYHPLGARGAKLMMNAVSENVTHICSASGTATTFAGLLLGKKDHQQVIAIPVLKGMHDFEERLLYLTGKSFHNKDLFIANDYHFGGYAKKTPGLLSFMNEIYDQCAIPTDFVYTGKMLFAIFDLIKKDFFPAGSRIACMHTGGLQGNNSIPKGTLTF